MQTKKQLASFNSEQFALMKNSKQGSTPQSTSDNDWIGIGSQSRTSSEKSDQIQNQVVANFPRSLTGRK